MTPEHNLINELYCKYGEWFESIGDDKSPLLMINILANMVIKQTENNEYLIKIIESKVNIDKGF